MENSSNFSLVMASDKKYIPYLTTAVASIRRYNNTVPIDVYTCAAPEDFPNSQRTGYEVHHVEIPQQLKDSLREEPEKLDHALTRIAKLASMKQEKGTTMMYVDSDIVALDDLGKITHELEVVDGDKPVVYMLLRRPQVLSLQDIGWLYFRDAANMSPQQIANLIHETFSLGYSAEDIEKINCWNSGIVYGSTEGIRMLTDLWSEYYLKMLTGENKETFIPNDQLCLWLAINKLSDKVTMRELPLAWNFMPGHALEQTMRRTNPSAQEIKRDLEGVRILHFAQNKTDTWVQPLLDELQEKE